MLEPSAHRPSSRTPENDAVDIGQRRCNGSGFEVTTELDADRVALTEALRASRAMASRGTASTTRRRRGLPRPRSLAHRHAMQCRTRSSIRRVQARL